jgi:hypothetical protein
MVRGVRMVAGRSGPLAAAEVARAAARETAAAWAPASICRGKLVPDGAVLGGRFLALALRVLGADEREVQRPDLLRVFVLRGL